MNGAAVDPTYRRLKEQRDGLLEACEQALEFAENHEDVRDGSDGSQIPNPAMSLCIILRAALKKARGEA